MHRLAAVQHDDSVLQLAAGDATNHRRSRGLMCSVTERQSNMFRSQESRPGPGPGYNNDIVIVIGSVRGAAGEGLSGPTATSGMSVRSVSLP